MNQNSTNESNNTASYAQCRIAVYATSFAGYSDEELKLTVTHERNVRGWCAERSYFLAALRTECKKRDIAY